MHRKLQMETISLNDLKETDEHYGADVGYAMLIGLKQLISRIY